MDTTRSRLAFHSLARRREFLEDVRVYHSSLLGRRATITLTWRHVAARRSVCNVSSVDENTVAEHTFALMLALARRLHEVREANKQPHFLYETCEQRILGARRLELSALALGLRVIHIALAFGMRVLATIPTAAR